MVSDASADMQDKFQIMSFMVMQKMEILGWRVNGLRRCWSEAMFLVGSSRSSLASARIETPMSVPKLMLSAISSRSSLASARIETKHQFSRR